MALGQGAGRRVRLALPSSCRTDWTWHGPPTYSFCSSSFCSEFGSRGRTVYGFRIVRRLLAVTERLLNVGSYDGEVRDEDEDGRAKTIAVGPSPKLIPLMLWGLLM